MTTKKKISPVEILKPIKVDEYKPVFETIEIIIPQKMDLNWISIRRKIQKFNFFKLIKAEQKKTHKEKYKFDYSIITNELKSVWDGYTFYFNKYINKIEDNP